MWSSAQNVANSAPSRTCTRVFGFTGAQIPLKILCVSRMDTGHSFLPVTADCNKSQSGFGGKVHKSVFWSTMRAHAAICVNLSVNLMDGHPDTVARRFNGAICHRREGSARQVSPCFELIFESLGKFCSVKG